MRSSKNSVNAGEEVEITLTAELLPILPSQLFFFDQQKTFRLKLLLPKGAQQTGGTYYDLIGETLKPDGLNQITYTWRGMLSSGDSTGCFRLLREVSSASDQALFIEKSQLCIQVGDPAFRDSVANQPKTDVSASKARITACSAPRVSWAGNSTSISLSWVAEDKLSSSEAIATLQAQTCSGTTKWYQRQADNTGLLVASGNSYTYVTHNYVSNQNVTYRYYATCVCADGESAPSADFPITITRKAITLTPTSTTACERDTKRTPLTVSGCPAGSTIKFYNSVAFSWTMTSTGDNSVYNTYGGVGEDTYQASCIFKGVEGPRSNSTTITSNCVTDPCAGVGTPSAPSIHQYGNTLTSLNVCYDGGLNLIANEGCTGTIKWYRQSDNAEMATGTTYNPDHIHQSVNYYATCSNDCHTSNTSNLIIITVLNRPTAPNIHKNNDSNTVNQTICQSSSVSLWADNCTNGVKWFKNGNYNSPVWEGNPFNSGNLEENTVFTARCKNTNDCGDSDNSNSVTVTINAKPSAAALVNVGQGFGSLSSYAVCEGSNIVLGMHTTPGSLNLQWYRPDGTLGASDTNWFINGITPSQAGTYTYKVTDNATGCTNSAQTTINVRAKPPINSLISYTGSGGFVHQTAVTLCEGNDLVLAMDHYLPNFPGASLRWSGPNGTQGPQNDNWIIAGITPAKAGVYTYTYTDANGCSNSETVTVTVNARPSAAALVNIGQGFGSLSSYTVCEGSNIVLGMHTTPGALNLQWYRPDGTLGTSDTNWFINGITPAQAGTYTYKVTNNATGCTNSAQVTINVNAKPVIYPQVAYTGHNFSSLSSYTVCEGNYLVFGMDRPPAGYTLGWRGPNGTQGPGNDNWEFFGVSVSQAGSYTYTVTNNATGCTNSAQVTLSVKAKPSATPYSRIYAQPFGTPSSQTVCEGGNIAFGMDRAGNPNFNMQWKAPNGSQNTVNTNWDIANLSPSQAGSYTYTVTDLTTGCSNTAQVMVTINVKPSAAALVNVGQGFGSLSSYTVCEGSNIVLGMHTMPGALNLQWYRPDGTLGTSDTNWFINGITPAQAGTYTYKVTNNATGCTNSAQTTINVRAKPPISSLISYTGSGGFVHQTTVTLCEGNDLVLAMDHYLPNFPGASLRWSGPNSTLGPQNDNWILPNITTSQAGTYTYTYTDANGCSNSETVTVTVRAKPVVNPLVSYTGHAFAAGSSYTVCEGNDVSFGMDHYLPNYPGASLSWRAPSGAQSNNDNLYINNITTTQAGSYTYTFTDATGCSNSAQVLINVNPKPSATPWVIANNNPFTVGTSFTVCEGSSLGLGLDRWPVPAGYTQRWSGPNGSQGPVNNNWDILGITPSQAGSYTYTVTDAKGCSNSAQVTITLRSGSTASLTLTARVAGTSSAQSLTLLAAGCPAGSTVQWSGPNNTTATGSSWIIASFTQTSTYSAQCQSSTVCPSSAQITVNYVIPNTPIIRTTATQVCAGQSVTLTADGCQTGTTVLWSGGQTGASLIFTPTATATYRAYCVVGEVTGDPSTQLGVTVLSSHTVTISGSQTYTIGETISLSAVSSASGSVTYRWTGPNNVNVTTQNLTIPTATTVMSGTYTVVATNATGCTATASASVSVISSFFSCTCQDCEQDSVKTTYNPSIDLMNRGSGGQNYVLESVYMDDAGSSVAQTITYLDGLGRPVQKVSVGTGGKPGAVTDVVSIMAYDAFGRETVKYLPFADATNNGAFRSASANDVSTYYTGLRKAGKAYTDISYEASPLNRVLSQIAPGTDNKAVTIAYRTNTANELPLLTYDYTTKTISVASYGAGKLYVTESTDENLNKSIEYKDLEGRVVGKVASGRKTLYVYDDFGWLRCVVPPKASGSLSTSFDPFAGDLLFAYDYDQRGRMTRKRVPGAGTSTMTYTDRDLLETTTDAKGVTVVTSYDKLDRVTSTSLANGQVLTKTFYDNYNYGEKGFDVPQAQAYNQTRYSAGPGNLNPQGMVTGNWTAVLSEASPGLSLSLVSSIYYDELGRVIQTVTDNHKGQVDRSSSKLDFIGRVTESKLSTLNGVVIENRTRYDLGSRVKSVCQQVTDLATAANGSTGQYWEPVARHSYNGIGELTHKTLGCGIQNVDYAYQMRGWLTGINNPDNLNTGSLPADKRFFGMSLTYDAVGNITTWNYRNAQANYSPTNNLIQQPAYQYSFSYDNLNRLKTGNLTQQGQTGSIFALGGDDNGQIRYDDNGNIKNLKRMFQNALTPVDNLAYTYKNGDTSNQLESVADAGSNPASPNAFFKDGTASYTYDASGNLQSDNSKSISNIEYNYLNLPKQITRTGGLTPINYLYSASGQKLKADFGSGKTYDYVAGLVYDQAGLEFIPTAEGRVLPPGRASTTITAGSSATAANAFYRYEYTLKDHLGNLRAACRCGEKAVETGPSDTQTPVVVQEQHYDPFGLNLTGLNTQSELTADRFAYNGKEEQQGLGWLDYGARMYDPASGRWTSTDPLAEKYPKSSPFTYVLNNPIKAIDPDGRLVIFVNGYYSKAASKAAKWFGISEIAPGSAGRDYWNYFDRGFINSAQNFFKDSNTRFVDGSSSFGGDMSGKDRFNEGFLYAAEHYSEIVSSLKEGETIKLVGHSEGAAFAAGIASFFTTRAKKFSNTPIVEAMLHLSPDEADEFDNPKEPTTYRVHDILDPVSPAFYHLSGVDYETITGGYKSITTDDIFQAHGKTVTAKTIDNLQNVLNQFMQNPNVKTITNKDGSTTYKRTDQ